MADSASDFSSLRPPGSARIRAARTGRLVVLHPCAGSSSKTSGSLLAPTAATAMSTVPRNVLVECETIPVRPGFSAGVLMVGASGVAVRASFASDATRFVCTPALAGPSGRVLVVPFVRATLAGLCECALLRATMRVPTNTPPMKMPATASANQRARPGVRISRAGLVVPQVFSLTETVITSRPRAAYGPRHPPGGGCTGPPGCRQIGERGDLPARNGLDAMLAATERRDNRRSRTVSRRRIDGGRQAATDEHCAKPRSGADSLSISTPEWWTPRAPPVGSRRWPAQQGGDASGKSTLRIDPRRK